MAEFDLRHYFYNRLRPEEPLDDPNDDRWVDLSEATAPFLEPLERRIVLEGEGGFIHQLVTGFIGSGKSTQLVRLKQRLDEAGFEVIYSRADPLVNQFRPTDVGEVLVYVAYALQQEGYGPHLLRGLLQEARSYLGGTVDVKEGEVSAGVVKVKAALNRDQTLREKLLEVGRARAGALATQVQELVQRVQARVRRKGKRGLVIILDALDKVVGEPENAQAVQDSVRYLLLERAELRQLPAHVILTVPPTMIRYGAALERVYTGELAIMPAVRTRHKDGRPCRKGLGALTQFMAKRAGGEERLAQAFGEDLRPLRRLIAASGGHLRDLMRMARACLEQAPELPVPSLLVDDMASRASQSFFEALYEEYKPYLRQMMADAGARFPRSEELGPMLQSLLRDGLVLRYHNADWWEGIHPLALRHLEPNDFRRLLDETENLAPRP